MKLEGIVKEYNGFNGKIVDKFGDSYLLLKEEIVDDKIINKLDVVTFVSEGYKINSIDGKIARFVRKKEKKKSK